MCSQMTLCIADANIVVAATRVCGAPHNIGLVPGVHQTMLFQDPMRPSESEVASSLRDRDLAEDPTGHHLLVHRTIRLPYTLRVGLCEAAHTRDDTKDDPVSPKHNKLSTI